MSREQVDLSPQQLGSIYQILSGLLTDRQKVQYRGFAVALQAQRNQRRSLDSQLHNLLDPATQTLNSSADLAANATRELEWTNWFITWPNFRNHRGGFGAALGNARLALHFLPFIGVSEHPMITPVRIEAVDAEVKLAQAQENFTTAKETTEALQPQISEARKSVEKTQSDLLAFAEMYVISSQDAMRRYVGVLPTRADELASRYTQTYSADPDRIPNLQGLLRLVSGGRKRRSVPYQHTLATDERLFTDLPYHKLPRPIQQIILSWITYQLKIEWAEEGLIPKPELPDNLRRS